MDTLKNNREKLTRQRLTRLKLEKGARAMPTYSKIGHHGTNSAQRKGFFRKGSVFEALI